MITVLIFVFLIFNRMEISYTQINSNINNYQTENNQIVIKYHEIRIDVQGPDSISIVEDIFFENNQNDSINAFEFCFNQTSYSNLAINVDFTVVDYYNVTAEGLITLILLSNISANQTCSFGLSYDLDFRLPYVSEEAYYFLPFDSFINHFTEKHIVSIRLPKYYILHEFEHGASSYIPEDAGTEFTGGRFYLTWELTDLEPNTNLPFVVYFDEPFSRPIPIWVIALILVAGLIGGALSVFWFMRRREKKAKKAIGDIYLTDDQNLILQLVHQNDGRIAQKELLALTNFSKAKLSRIVSSLEELGFITKEKWGREFRVYITKNGRKVVE